jgi:hypothetical protein
MPEDTPDPRITLNPRGVPCLDLAADHMAHGDRAAHTIEPPPDRTPAHVHAALAYDDDHQEAMDPALVASDARAEHQRRRHTPHPKLVAAWARQAGSCGGCPGMCT